MIKLENNEEKHEIGLYIHIPFCKSKCYYCDFLSFSDKNNLKEKYIHCLEKEIEHYATENKILYEHKLEKKFMVKTIYMGGGTPSVVDEIYIANIIKKIKKNFELSKDIEITIEVNPGTVTKEKLSTYNEIGINRLIMRPIARYCLEVQERKDMEEKEREFIDYNQEETRKKTANSDDE